MKESSILGKTQKDFYLEEKMLGGNCHHYENKCVDGVFYYSHNDNFDPNAMEKAYFEMLSRNDAFRMKLIKKRWKVQQIFQNVEDFPSPNRMYYEKDINCFLDELNQLTPPQMSMLDQNLTKAEIIICKDGNGGLLLWQHHLCTDGYSEEVICYKQLSDFYEQYNSGNIPSKPKKIFSVADYFFAQQKNRKKYFRKSFKWYFSEFNKHVSFFKTPIRSINGEKKYAFESVRLSGDKAKKFDQFAKENSCSDTVLLIVASAAVISEITQAKRFIITSVSHGRATYANKQTSGALLKSLPVFCDLVEPVAIKEFIQEENRKLIQSLLYMNFSFTEMVFLFSGLSCLFSRTSPKDLLWFGINNMRTYESKDKSLLKMIPIEKKGGSFPMCLKVENEGEDILINFHYYDNLISKSQAKLFVKKLDRAIDYIMNNDEKSMSDCINFVRHTND